MREYFFKRSSHRGAWQSVDKNASDDVRQKAQEFKKSAKACFAHFMMAKKAKTSGWDYKYAVKGNVFSDFVGFLFTSDEDVLMEWGLLGKALRNGKVVDSRKDFKGEEKVIYVVSYFSLFLCINVLCLTLQYF